MSGAEELPIAYISQRRRRYRLGDWARDAIAKLAEDYNQEFMVAGDLQPEDRVTLTVSVVMAGEDRVMERVRIDVPASMLEEI